MRQKFIEKICTNSSREIDAPITKKMRQSYTEKVMVLGRRASMISRGRRLSRISTEAVQRMKTDYLNDFIHDDNTEESSNSGGNSCGNLSSDKIIRANDNSRDELPPIFRDGNFVMDDDGMIIMNADRYKKTAFSRIHDIASFFRKVNRNEDQKEPKKSNNRDTRHSQYSTGKRLSLTRKYRSRSVIF